MHDTIFLYDIINYPVPKNDIPIIIYEWNVIKGMYPICVGNHMDSINTEKSKYPVLDYIEVPKDVLGAWQEIVDLISDIFHVPTALIMRAHERHIEVFVRNQNAAHPYKPGNQEFYETGLYCEYVMSNKNPLLMADALNDPRWCQNPWIKRGMISYLGMPLTWPRGEIFGTICVMDTKENHYSEQLIKLLQKFSRLVISDLHGIWATLELEKANEQTRRLNKQMHLFLGIAAHDLKNSLNVLLGCSNMLLEKVTAQTKKERTYLELIHRSGITMQNLLDELLDISRIETTRFPLIIQEIDLLEVVKDDVQFNQHLAEAKGIQVNLIAPAGPLMARIDPAKIDQVLNNLISNAIKFSPRFSTITVSVDNRADEIVVAVQDQGPGIPIDEQYNLFRPFQTTSIQPSSGETSTGLGLYIARRIVEEHGGRIWVESETGTGSMFCFSLKNIQDTVKKPEATLDYDSVKHLKYQDSKPADH